MSNSELIGRIAAALIKAELYERVSNKFTIYIKASLQSVLYNIEKIDVV